MKHKRRNRMISAAIAAVLCLFLAGCGKASETVPQMDTSGKIETDGSDSEEKLQGTSEDVSMDVSIDVSEESASQGMEAEIPDFYEKEAGAVSFQTDVVVSEEVRKNGLQKISVSPQKPDPAKVLECLMGDTEITEKNEEEGNNWYVGADGENLTIHHTSIGFATKFYVYVSNAFRLQQEYSDYNADKYETDKDLEFASRQEAFEDIYQMLETMGIQIGEQYKCYVLEHSVLQREEYAMDINGNIDQANYKGSWTGEDDSYYFAISQKYGDTPAYHVFYDHSPLAADENAPIQVLYNKDGIQFLQLEKVFTFTEQEGNYDLMPFEEIAEVIETKYEAQADGNTYSVRRATLYYMENKVNEQEYEVVPVWIFNTVQNETGKNLQDIVNAQTGEEIIWEDC